MRYRLDANGYVESVFWGCYSNGCAEYTGTVPYGYTDLNDWSTNALINAYYIDEKGNLKLDSDRLADLEAKIEQETIDNTPILYKDLYGTNNVLNTQYQSKTAIGEVIEAENVKKINPSVIFTNIDCYKNDKLDIVTQGRQMLTNDTKTETISGVSFIRKNDGGLIIFGKAEEDIEYNISGGSENTSSIFALKKDLDYYLNLNGLECSMKYYDGTTSIVYEGASGVINLSENKEVTQVSIKIAKGTVIECPTLPLTLDNTTGNYYLEGVSFQETRSGKNLLKGNLSSLAGFSNGVTASYDSINSNEVTLSGTSTGTWANISGSMPDVLPAGTYTLSIDKPIPYGLNIKGSYEDGTIFENGIAIGSTSKTFTITKSVLRRYIFVHSFATGTNVSVKFKFQLEKGSTATEIEEYGVSPSPDYPSEIINKYPAGTYNAIVDNKVFNITLDEPLRSLPNVSDKLIINPTNNTYQIERKVGRVVLNGSEIWIYNSSGDRYMVYIKNSFQETKRHEILSSHFRHLSSGSEIGGAFNYDKHIYIYPDTSIITTMDELKTWLSNNNVEVLYELATPITEEITLTEANLKAIYPMLNYGSKPYNYEKYKTKTLTLDFSEYISPDALFPSDNLYPSDDLYPLGTTISYIRIEDGKVYISVDGIEKYLTTGNVNLFDGYNLIYTMQDSKINMQYSINLLDVNSLEFLQGKATTTNKFKILEDGSIEAHNGYFSGVINGGSINVSDVSTIDDPYVTISKKDTEDLVATMIWNNGVSVWDYSIPEANALIRTECSDGFAELHNSEVNAFSFNNVSLEKVKKNIKKTEKGLDLIKKADVCSYNYRGEKNGDKKHIGLVIGEKYNTPEEIMNSQKTGIDLYSMIAVAWQSIKELNNKIEELENKIKEMEGESNELQQNELD